MKLSIRLLAAFALAAVLLSPFAHGQSSTARGSELDVLGMQSVPDGHYFVNLLTEGTERLLNINVKDDAATCVNASDPRFEGLEGKFELIGNGVFHVVFRNKEHTASQWWLFRKDGSATVKEIPDRGEMERAIPVPNESLKRPDEP